MKITRKWKNRIIVLALIGMVFSAATLLMLKAFEDNIIFFYSPSDLLKKKPPQDRDFRIGGLVLEGSIKRSGDQTISFIITDLANEVKATYHGVVPALFTEGQGVVALGRMDHNGIFKAQEILAKHDENYMPKEVADALKKSGNWEGAYTKSQNKLDQ
jgi:cytochrome c-type biogenesis protein CcmE